MTTQKLKRWATRTPPQNRVWTRRVRSSCFL